ncbi:MAG: hypothetical protein JNL58_14225 [Planctomyces sp.]|nr:hypothetical protein [Planctomyces sp.]
MKLKLFAGLLAVLTIVGVIPASAQEPHHSRITVLHPGFDSLKDDLKSVLDLTTEAEQTQWDNLRDYIDTLQIGVDGSRPVRVDVLTGVTPSSYLVWVPLMKPENAKGNIADDFRDSMEAFGYETERDTKDRTLYRIRGEEGTPDTGWFRVLPEIEYGIFVLTTNEKDMNLLKQVVLKAGDPLTDLSDLKSASQSMGAEIVNNNESADDQAKRLSAFGPFRKETLGTIQKRPDESEAAFKLRHDFIDQQLDELQRLLVEAKTIRAFANLDRETKKSSLSFSAKAIEGTSLADTIAQLATKPDAFASVPRMEGSALSLRVNHPIDSMRQENSIETVVNMEADFNETIDKATNLSADEKTTAKKFLKDILDLTQDGIRTGYINLMVEAVADDNDEFTIVAAVSATKATRLNTILPELAKAGKGNTVEVNVATQGDVTIHRIQLAEGFVNLVDRVFGVKQDLFVGVTEDYVWLASGPGALDKLKATISQVGEPVTTSTVIHAEGNLLPWMKRLDKIAATAPEGKTPEEKEAKRSRDRMRARAIAAFESSDAVTIDVKVTDGVVEGLATFDVGMMKFAGKAISAFSKENLNE